MEEYIDSVLDFWFGELDSQGREAPGKAELWFKKSDAFDKEIREKFGEVWSQAVSGKLDEHVTSPRSALALIIVLDQFSRNLFRQSPEAFASDDKALSITKSGMEKGWDKELPLVMRHFFYMPFMHSEDLDDQKKSLELYNDLVKLSSPPLNERFKTVYDFAKRHYDIIERFGRFPHRNSILGRESTPEEVEFLKQPGSSF